MRTNSDGLAPPSRIAGREQGTAAMTRASVDRCIAIAAHGRRCQQSTYRGSPYCWHHNQSRKVWAPSRAAARPATADRTTDVPVIPLAAAPPAPPATPLDRIAARLNQGQLEQLARFLEGPGEGTLVITRAHGYVEVRGAARPLPAASGARTGT